MSYKPKVLTVAEGGTGLATLTSHAVQVGNGTGTISQLSVGTNGQVLIGSTGANPAFATIGSSSLTLTTGAGTLSIDVQNYATSTFSPTLVGASTAGSTSYNTQSAVYTRFLNLCLVYGIIDLASATGTGDILIGNLPFTIKNITNGDVMGEVSFSGSWAWPASHTNTVLYGLQNTTTAKIQVTGSSQSAAFMQMTNAAAVVYFNLLYQV